MKVLIILIVLFVFIQCLLISSLLIESLFNIYEIIGVSILLTFIGWNFVDYVERKLLPNKPIEPKGRSVFITGCDSGFGYESAISLRAKGYHVLATVVSNESEGAVSLKAKGITTIEMNVLDDRQISRAFDLVVKECEANQSELWAVVNNAGVYACGELEWGRIEDLENLVKINVFGYIKIIRTFLPLIRKSRGRIVNVSSVAALFSAPGTIIYSMSKCAVSSMTDGLRRELYNKGVDVIEIQPQAYKNSMTDRIVKGLDECWIKTNENVKNDFGEHYYQEFRSYISRNIDSCRNGTHEVVDTITDSVSLSRVRYRYLCCGLTDRLILWSFYLLPIELLEPIVSLFTVRCKPSWASKTRRVPFES